MSISAYIREIGRGKDGARALTREQAADLMGQVLDDQVSDLELGAFCLAMRIKGETPEEMAGFLDATESRLNRTAPAASPVVVLPSYNGARKLPGLLPLLALLLALLLAQRGLPVLIHGCATESSRVYTTEVLKALGIEIPQCVPVPELGQVRFVPTTLLSPALFKLLEVRRVVGLRNPGHSLVKLMNPVAEPALLVSSYTHPEYAHAMSATLALREAHALLLRGTEGEPVADPRRTPHMKSFLAGKPVVLEPPQTGTLLNLPPLPTGPEAQATAVYIRSVLDGKQEVPAPVAIQVAHILHLHAQIS
jgi:anthranilate phosphoribosyltransferase